MKFNAQLRTQRRRDKRHEELVDATIEYLNLMLRPHGGRAWQNDTGVHVHKNEHGTWVPDRKYGTPGVADILGMLNGGRLLACEVKTGDGRLTRDQREFRDFIQGGGGFCMLCRDDIGSIEERTAEAVRICRENRT